MKKTIMTQLMCLLVMLSVFTGTASAPLISANADEVSAEAEISADALCKLLRKSIS